jgi:predicted hotdog family 3-hydroxylacyl-ACP dehydratase
MYGFGVNKLGNIVSQTRPTFSLDFASEPELDPRVTFTRASTGTYLDSDGVLKTASVNTPRIEYDADGNLLGLLIEEQRTNLLTYSEQFDNAAWIKSNATVTANTIVAPDGTLTGDKLVENTATDLHRIDKASTATSGVTYTATIYAKKAEVDILAIDYSGILLGTYNLTTGVATLGAGNANSVAVSASMLSVGNGWYRCAMTFTRAGASIDGSYRFSPRQNTSYTGDGTSGIYIWGAQLEAGSFPTSYIKTEGATATRSADVASIATSEFGYNDAAGTLYVDGTFRDTETIVTLGSTTIDADADGKKDYTATYSADPSATSLALNRGAYNALKYYPRVLTSAQLEALTS